MEIHNRNDSSHRTIQLLINNKIFEAHACIINGGREILRKKALLMTLSQVTVHAPKMCVFVTT
jgi:hypothetical protein